MTPIHVIRDVSDNRPVYGVVLGSNVHRRSAVRYRGDRKRVRAVFHRPATLAAILPGLRYLQRKGAPLHALSDYLAAGVKWAEARQEA